MTAIFVLLALSLGLAAGRDIWKRGEETRPRCWLCGRTFSDQQGLTWHDLSTHPFDDSATYDKKGRIYRD